MRDTERKPWNCQQDSQKKRPEGAEGHIFSLRLATRGGSCSKNKKDLGIAAKVSLIGVADDDARP